MNKTYGLSNETRLFFRLAFACALFAIGVHLYVWPDGSDPQFKTIWLIMFIFTLCCTYVIGRTILRDDIQVELHSPDIEIYRRGSLIFRLNPKDARLDRTIFGQWVLKLNSGSKLTLTPMLRDYEELISELKSRFNLT